VRGSLPREVVEPVVAKEGADAQPFYWRGVRGENYTLLELTDIAYRIVKTRLQTLPGVGQAQIFGEVEKLITRKDGNRTLISGSEKQILEKFCTFLPPGDRFISFNGREFDGPFLMFRTVIHGVPPNRDLVRTRYRFHQNCVLREFLNFNGTINPRQMRFNLDLACKAFGIVSSKPEGMDGRSVETMYRAGRYEDTPRREVHGRV
jgi:hypothetical protein